MPKNAEVAPPPDEYLDVKPGLSSEEQAALELDDEIEGDGDEVAAGADPDSDAENSMASPTPEDQTDEQDPPGDDTQLDEAAAADEDDDEAETGSPPNAEPEEIPRGMQLNTQIRASRQFAANIAQEIAGVDEKIEGLIEQLDSGEIELGAYTREVQALNVQRQELVADQREQEILQNTNQALVETDWNTSVAQFMGANPNFQNPIMHGAFQAALNELYAVPDNLGSSHHWYLETAKRAVLEQITPAEATLDSPPDNAGTPQQQRQQQIQETGKQRAQKAASAREKVPTTLADMPAAGDNPGGDDEFSSLDNLEGLELESALSKMSPEQQDRYLRAGY